MLARATFRTPSISETVSETETEKPQGGLTAEGAAGLLGDGTTLPALVSSLKPPPTSDVAGRGRWLAGAALGRGLSLVGALLGHCEGRSEGIALQVRLLYYYVLLIYTCAAVHCVGSACQPVTADVSRM